MIEDEHCFIFLDFLTLSELMDIPPLGDVLRRCSPLNQWM